MRKPFRIRTVVREYFWCPWACGRHESAGRLRQEVRRYVELSCGHEKRDPFEVYGNETAVQIRDLVRHLAEPGQARKCRCYQCGKLTVDTGGNRPHNAAVDNKTKGTPYER